MDSLIELELVRAMENPAQNQARITALLGTNNWLVHRANVAGTSFRTDLDRFLDCSTTSVETRLELEPTNPYDPAAIKVVLTDQRDGSSHHVGYVPRGLNHILFMPVNFGMAVARFHSMGPANADTGKARFGITLLILSSFNPKTQTQLTPHLHQIAEFHRFTTPNHKIAA